MLECFVCRAVQAMSGCMTCVVFRVGCGRLEEVLVELRLMALRQATAWVAGHSHLSLRAYLFAEGRKAHEARAAKASEQAATSQEGGGRTWKCLDLPRVLASILLEVGAF